MTRRNYKKLKGAVGVYKQINTGNYHAENVLMVFYKPKLLKLFMMLKNGVKVLKQHNKMNTSQKVTSQL